MPPFRQVVSFGDSFTDNGFINGHGFRRYTNTWTWTEYLAQLLDVPHDNWAFGGAMSNQRNQAHPAGTDWSGIAWQVDQYLAGVTGQDLSQVLFTRMGGSNDYWGGQMSGVTAAQNLRANLDALIAAGAKHLLFRETTTVLLSPGYLSGAWAADGPAWKQLVDDTNAEARQIIQADLPSDHPGVNLYYLSSDPLFTKIANGEPGFEFDILDDYWLGSYDFPYPHKYLWWDEWHPMGIVHLMMAEEALEALTGAIVLNGGQSLPGGLVGLGPQTPPAADQLAVRAG
jgi:phospholipase/lecithinase/hemolysin